VIPIALFIAATAMMVGTLWVITVALIAYKFYLAWQMWKAARMARVAFRPPIPIIVGNAQLPDTTRQALDTTKQN